ncbi:MAG: transporter substrate-binding domain-containing protein [Polyangiaceae bacterium]|nr:transporter substrate-binding domain-containing protein [Polyangiaceae bacterium]
MGLYENSPKVGTGADGRPEGIFVDIIQAIAASEDWTLTWVPGTWQEGLERLLRGEIDLMPDVAFTAERDRLYAFHSEPVLSSWNQIYASRHTDIRALPDLDGRRVAVLGGSLQQEQFEGMVAGFGLRITLVPSPDYESAFRAVADGQADAVVTNRYYGVRRAAEFGLVDTAIIFSPSQLYFAAPLGRSASLLAAIDRRLKALKQDSTSAYYDSLRRWATDETPPAWPSWLLWAALAVALTLPLALIWVLTLRRTAARLRASDERQRQLLGELAVARDAAEAADRTKSAFLATMSHELRTPLNSIIGFSGILLQGLPGPLNAEQEKQLGMVYKSSEHLLALINDILDLSKIEAGQLQLDSESFELRSSIERVVDTVRPQAAKKGLVLEVDIAPEVGAMTSDRRRVEQVLLNLLSNGIKFTESGSVRVEVSVEGDRVAVRVSDTGMGIQDAELGRLFKPFSQLDTGINKRHEGTGLGLSICKRLVELLGGTIWAKSEWGKGSTFGFELPIEKRTTG